jgi:hypothetical protein
MICIIIQVWCHTSVIPALRRLKQEDYEFKASLGYRGHSRLAWETLQVLEIWIVFLLKN